MKPEPGPSHLGSDRPLHIVKEPDDPYPAGFGLQVVPKKLGLPNQKV